MGRTIRGPILQTRRLRPRGRQEHPQSHNTEQEEVHRLFPAFLRLSASILHRSPVSAGPRRDPGGLGAPAGEGSHILQGRGLGSCDGERLGRASSLPRHLGETPSSWGLTLPGSSCRRAERKERAKCLQSRVLSAASEKTHGTHG